jgi:hypothetical protein
MHLGEVEVSAGERLIVSLTVDVEDHYLLFVTHRILRITEYPSALGWWL